MIVASRRNVSILAVLLAGLIVLAIVVQLNKRPFKSRIFKRCDGRDEPLGHIEISTCPDVENLEACGIILGSKLTVDVEFTSPRDVAKPRFGMEFHSYLTDHDACKAEGVECPIKAGVKQRIKTEIDVMSSIGSTEPSAKLVMFERLEPSETSSLSSSLSSNFDIIYLFCAEFPVDFVSPRPGKFEFKRCDGLKDKIEFIEVSSCLDAHEVGYCTIKDRERFNFEVSFTPAVDFDDAGLIVTGSNIGEAGFNLCGNSGLICPSRAGVQQNLRRDVDVFGITKDVVAPIKFSINDALSKNYNVLFCVEFPAKIV